MAAVTRAVALGAMLALIGGGSEAAPGARDSAPVEGARVRGVARVRATERRVTHVVDSILPIEEELRRFQEILGPPPKSLAGGAHSRDDLVDRFARAVTLADTAALLDLLMTRDEFGWIYYPSSRFTTPPYELAPALIWFQIESNSSKGLGRLLTRLGGLPLDVASYECAPDPDVKGRNRIWRHCTVRVVPPAAEPFELKLFGSILERDGRFKFVSYGNGF